MELIYKWIGIVVLCIVALFALVYISSLLTNIFFERIFKDSDFLRVLIEYVRYRSRLKEYMTYKDYRLSQKEVDVLMERILEQIGWDSSTDDDFDLDSKYRKLGGMTKESIADEINKALQNNKQGNLYY